MDQQQLQELFERYYNRTATPAETAALMRLINEAPEETLAELIRQQGAQLPVAEPVISPDVAEQMLQHILGAQLPAAEPVISPDVAEQMLQHILPDTTTPVRRISWWRYAVAVAAGLLLLLGISRLMRTPAPVPVAHQPVADITPGKEHATLTLGDASVIGLDTAANGLISRQGNTAVQLVNGQLVYSGGSNANTTTINTISTGRGNYYSMVLTDGTRVWLNAASSLRFPVTFAANERQVTVTGEVYFEVAPDAAKPFRVQIAGKGSITVLGTHFNVHAYDDENDITTTLLEGAVVVRKGREQQLLTPGQQGIINQEPGISVRKQADLAQVMAWKEGYFSFNDTNIYALMKQISRWYDVEVRFEGKVTEDGFSGKISRNAPLTSVLQILELNGVHFKIAGRQITVMP